MGLKCLSLYRDGCKLSQPLSTSVRQEEEKAEAKAEAVAPPAPKRRRLPDERESLTHKFSIAGHEGYITVGLYPDTKQPGEIFITMSKQGSTVAGLMDSFATAISLALQYGVPLEVLVNKFSHMRFEPAGWTNNPQIRMAKSIMDYIFRWLALKYLPDEDQPPAAADLNGQYFAALMDEEEVSRSVAARESAVFLRQSDAPSCHECGALMVRNGTCYKCLNCGATSGCS
jgi:ribonucleoside-diphosphate reductase alpha chain